jgi:CubicO group peptidase (beta-lactamase class C family)
MDIKTIFNFLLVKISIALLQRSIGNSYFQNECICKSEEDLKIVIKKTRDYIENVRKTEIILGVVTGISVKGKDVWIKGFERTDIENNIKTRKDSVRRMASISKPLTTVLIGKLIKKGLIDLEKSIHQYLSLRIFPIKQWNDKNVTITVKRVMSHTAGLRITQFPEDFMKIYNFENVTQTVEQIKGEPLLFEPGTNFAYSN